MSTPAPNPAPAPAPRPPAAHRPSWTARAWSASQFLIALSLTIAALTYLILNPASRPAGPVDDAQAGAEETVRLSGPGLIRVNPDTPIGRRLQVAEVQPTRITAPVLTVTGTVVASLRPAPGKVTSVSPALGAVTGSAAAAAVAGDYWQFNAPEVLTAFTDWQRAKADIAFNQTQLADVKELAAAKLMAQQEVLDRAEKDFKVGSGTKEKWEIAKNDLEQIKITGRKDVHDAETALARARRDEAALARQLQQSGLDPSLLTSVTSDVDIVMADVPEGFLGRVKAGQGCEARFFGIPEQAFTGRVNSIAPVIAKERRSLRVLFTIDDLNDQLRPGMFAEIGLGTDARNALLAPSEGVIHVGRTDYLLVGGGQPDVWRVTAVEVGETRAGRVEILKGLRPGDRVVGAGAILLKPVIVKAVQPATGNGGRP